jgi:hypothetical protein
MPVLMVSEIDFLYGYYCINISALKYTFPQIEADKYVNIFLIEVRDEKNKIIKKFAPFKEQLCMKILNIPGTKLYFICLPTDISDELGIGQDYKVVFIITKYDNKPLAPEYIKYIGEGSEKYQKLFKNIGIKLLTLLYSIDNDTLRGAANYVLNAYHKLKNREIEDSRTWLRKALEKLEEIFDYEIKVSKDESEEYPKYICKLIKALKNFVNYGGPHEGPAPEHTTKFILYVIEKLIEHLSYSIYKGVISIDFNKPSNSNPCKEIKKENQNDLQNKK